MNLDEFIKGRQASADVAGFVGALRSELAKSAASKATVGDHLAALGELPPGQDLADAEFLRLQGIEFEVSRGDATGAEADIAFARAAFAAAAGVDA